MSLNDVKNIKENGSAVLKGIKGVFAGLATSYLIATAIHDISTGESLLSKSWHSVVVNNMEETDFCHKNKNINTSVLCEKRGEGKGLSSLLPEKFRP